MTTEQLVILGLCAIATLIIAYVLGFMSGKDAVFIDVERFGTSIRGNIKINGNIVEYDKKD